MRIPHTLRVNVIRVYASSTQSRQLLGEMNRSIESDNFSWDKYDPLSLMDTCVKVMAEGFEMCYEYIKRLPRQDLDYVLEILRTDLPVHLTVPVIEDGVYWKRCCDDNWPDETINLTKSETSWKKAFLERYLQQVVESQIPNQVDWTTLELTVNACADYVTRLHLQQLLPPPNLELRPVSPDECVRGTPITSHLDIRFLLARLHKLQQLSIRYGVKECGMTYEHYYFQISEADVTDLAEGLRQGPTTLNSFALHRCQIDDIKLNILLGALIDMENLTSLDFSHCNFGNIGAKSLAKLISLHKSLKELNIENNSFGEEGLMAVAFVLNKKDSCPLEVLKLDLNIFGDEGAKALGASLVNNSTLTKLSLAGCGITIEGLTSLMAALRYNTTLLNLNLSSNNFSNECCTEVMIALEFNTCIQVLDLRNTGIDNEALSNFETFIRRNRKILRRSRLSEGNRNLIDFF
ncbi:dynein regulatory complex subunit 5 [Nilaparvata lugens]|uniref:dynein regulatory complex subunit 5 n=1 Tax=Nilaparvata lugens TaxID=108931 RepID=UPI00193E5620|nr:dynein regulatory complex subunit 5 [Nilaparvata lugens]XP_039282091.1 dynein regulatory complex subunit 5 [Nilaparvata lugens]